MQRAVESVSDLQDDFVAAGFSNGDEMAEYVATQRSVAGVLMLSGALPLEMMGVEQWPAILPAQIRYTIGDPFRDQEGVDKVVASIRAAGAEVETFDYPGRGHLFTDKSLVDEHDPRASQQLWERVFAFGSLNR